MRVDASRVQRVSSLCLQLLAAAGGSRLTRIPASKSSPAPRLFTKRHPVWVLAKRWGSQETEMHKTILTVDDSRTMRNMLMLALANAGHTVIQAEDGVHGVEVLAQNPSVDVIITDINMPRMDGFGFIEHVRRESAPAPRRSWC